MLLDKSPILRKILPQVRKKKHEKVPASGDRAVVTMGPQDQGNARPDLASDTKTESVDPAKQEPYHRFASWGRSKAKEKKVKKQKAQKAEPSIVSEKKAKRELALKRGFGVYVENDRVYVSDVVYGLKGPVIQKSVSHSVTEKPLPAILKETLLADRPQDAKPKPASGSPITKCIETVKEKIKNLPVIFEAGVSDTDAFFSTFPMPQLPTRKTTIDHIIGENPKAAFLGGNDLFSDWVGMKIGERFFALVSAAKKTLIKKVLQEFYALDLNPVRVEPGPWAALRASWHYAKPLSRKDMEIRVIFGEDKALVAMTQGLLPMAWQVLPLDSVNILKTLTSPIKQMMIMSRWKLRTPGVKKIVLQGRQVPEETINQLSDQLNVIVQPIPGPCYDGNLTAFGLALAALRPDDQAVNLAKPVQRPVHLSTIFPRMETAAALLAVCLVLTSLGSQASSLNRKVKSLKRQNAQASWAIGKKPSILEKVNEKLLMQALPLQEYVTDNVPWASFFEGLSKLLPPNAQMVQVQAEDQIWRKTSSSKDLGERFMILRFSAEFNEGGKMPRQIDDYLHQLREHPAFEKNFQNVRLSALNWRKDFGKELAYATVMCTPKRLKMSTWKAWLDAQKAKKFRERQ